MCDVYGVWFLWYLAVISGGQVSGLRRTFVRVLWKVVGLDSLSSRECLGRKTVRLVVWARCKVGRCLDPDSGRGCSVKIYYAE